MKQHFVLTLIFLLILSTFSAEAKQHSYEKINAISKRIDQAQNHGDKAQQLAYRARLYTKGNNYNMAINDYTRAIRLTNAGWLWNELGYTCLKAKRYIDAQKIAKVLKKEHPQFKTDADVLFTKSTRALAEIKLKEHPPEIVYTNPARKIKSRLDVKRERQAMVAASSSPRTGGQSSSIRKYCREVAGAGGSYSYTIEKGCIDMETKAREKVSRRRVPHEVSKYCKEVAGAGGSYSYTIEKGCIDMEMKARGSLGY